MAYHGHSQLRPPMVQQRPPILQPFQVVRRNTYPQHPQPAPTWFVNHPQAPRREPLVTISFDDPNAPPISSITTRICNNDDQCICDGPFCQSHCGCALCTHYSIKLTSLQRYKQRYRQQTSHPDIFNRGAMFEDGCKPYRAHSGRILDYYMHAAHNFNEFGVQFDLVRHMIDLYTEAEQVNEKLRSKFIVDGLVGKVEQKMRYLKGVCGCKDLEGHLFHCGEYQVITWRALKESRARDDEEFEEWFDADNSDSDSNISMEEDNEGNITLENCADDDLSCMSNDDMEIDTQTAAPPVASSPRRATRSTTKSQHTELINDEKIFNIMNFRENPEQPNGSHLPSNNPLPSPSSRPLRSSTTKRFRPNSEEVEDDTTTMTKGNHTAGIITEDSPANSGQMSPGPFRPSRVTRSGSSQPAAKKRAATMKVAENGVRTLQSSKPSTPPTIAEDHSVSSGKSSPDSLNDTITVATPAAEQHAQKVTTTAKADVEPQQPVRRSTRFGTRG